MCKPTISIIWAHGVLYLTVVGGVACGQATTPSATQPAAELREPTTQAWKDLAAELEALRKNPPKTTEEADRAKDLHAKLVGMAISSAKSDFRLKGEVVDESGHRMKGVKMTITRSAAPYLGGREFVDGRRESEEKVIDGTFDVTARGWWAVGISFTKDGYYPEELSLMSDASTESVKKLLERGNVEPSPVIKDGLTVQMVQRSVPSATVLEAGRSFEMQPESPTQYLIFGQFEKAPFAGRTVNQLPLKVAKAASRPVELPENAFTIEVPRKDAAFLLSGTTMIPQTIVLRLNAPHGGILLHNARADFGLLMMRETPENGYLPEVTIAADSPYMARIITSERGKGAYFYFKTSDGKYGKGYIHGRFIRRGDEKGGRFEFGVKIYLQTDGSRNVQTKD